MSKPIAIVVGLLLLALLTLFSATYTVNFHQVVIKSRFGQLHGQDSIVREPGLKFRLPFFADRTPALDTRLQLIEPPLETIPTSDGQQVVVKAFLMWRVDTEGLGPLDFFKTYTDTQQASPRLTDRFVTSLSVLSQYSFDELVGGDKLAQAEQAVLVNMQGATVDEGVVPVMVGISQMLMPPKTTSGVLSRMKATQTRRSELERFKGTARAREIESGAGAMADKILAFTEQRAAEIRATGDERAAEFLREMSEDEDLAILLVWLEALREALAEQTTVIIPANIAPFHLMNLASETDERGLPQPEMELSMPKTTASDTAAGGDTAGEG
jgi:regulator of protease activity HflC (stomatin/prohibitin superfamily)